MILENFCVIRENSNLPKTNLSKQQCKVDFFFVFVRNRKRKLSQLFCFYNDGLRIRSYQMLQN